VRAPVSARQDCPKRPFKAVVLSSVPVRSGSNEIVQCHLNGLFRSVITHAGESVRAVPRSGWLHEQHRQERECPGHRIQEGGPLRVHLCYVYHCPNEGWFVNQSLYETSLRVDGEHIHFGQRVSDNLRLKSLRVEDKSIHGVEYTQLDPGTATARQRSNSSAAHRACSRTTAFSSSASSRILGRRSIAFVLAAAIAALRIIAARPGRRRGVPEKRAR
jgi:hypothetical protein